MGLSAAWLSAALSDANGAALLSAQGRNNLPAAAAIDGSAWHFRMDEAGRPYDDVDFIDQLIGTATASSALLGAAIDPSRIYLVGESRGAGFAYVLYADPRTSKSARRLSRCCRSWFAAGRCGATPKVRPRIIWPRAAPRST